jgi:hypothetical protein
VGKKKKLSRPAHQKTQNLGQAPLVVRGRSECDSQAVLCDALYHLFRSISWVLLYSDFCEGLVPAAVLTRLWFFG